MAISAKKIDQLASDIYNLLLKYECWQDVSIYYNGKCMSTHKKVGNGYEFRYGGEPFITDGVNPRYYFDYVANPHILSMSFEGPFNHVMNYGYLPRLLNAFDKLLNSYGLYYELGNSWNLTCYEV